MITFESLVYTEQYRYTLTMREVKFLLRLFVILLSLQLLSCKDNGTESTLLNKARDLVREYPHQALIVLDSIKNPKEELSKDEYMRYVIIYALAEDNNSLKAPESEVELQEVLQYSKEKKDVRLEVLVNYCLGNYYLQKEDYSEALKCYYNAAFDSEKRKDYYSAGRSLYMVGWTYYQQGLYSEAARLCKLSLDYYQKTSDVERETMFPLNLIGNWCYDILELDSAQVYYTQGLEVARHIESKPFVSRFQASIGNVLLREGKYDEGLAYLDSALIAAENIKDSLYIYKGFLLAYNKMNNTAEAKKYAQMLEPNLSIIPKGQRRKEAFAELSRYYERIGDAETALAYRKRESGVFYTMERMKGTDNFLSIKKEYDLALKNLDLEYQRWVFFEIIVIVVLISVLISGFLFLRARSNRFKKEEQEHKNILLEERVENFEYLRSMYKSTIVRLMRVEKQVDTLIEESRKESEEIPPVYIEMKELIESIRRTSNYQYVKVAEDFILKQPNGAKFLAMLDRPNKILFMLCNFRYNQSEMASMLGMTRKSVMMRRYDLRNALIKVGASEKEANAAIFYENEEDRDEEEDNLSKKY